MPRDASSRTACRQSAGQAHASQRNGQARSQDGNPQSFQIGWPVGFRSRTCNPHDPCYVGRSTDAQRNTPALNQRPGGAEGWIPVGLRIKAGTLPWRMWRLLVLRGGGPLAASEIAVHLDIPTVQVYATAKRMIVAEAVLTRKLLRGFEYRIGPTRVVEV